MQIKFIGHATFELSDGDARVLVDPFLAPNNPAAVVSADDVDPPTHILLTHGHSDHTADAVAVAKRTGARVVAITELAGWLEDQGLEKVVTPTSAARSSSTGAGSSWSPPGIRTPTPRAARSARPRARDHPRRHHGLPPRRHRLFGDLRLIGERHSPDVALVPIGGHFTMDIEDAAYACGLIGAATVIPCHYNTFPPIETDAEAFKQQVESESSRRS